MTGDSDSARDPQRTVLRVGETDVELTSEDASAIQQALVEYLQQSSHEAREQLIKWSRPAFIDGDGTLRVGLWLLDSEDERMVLRLRERPARLGGRAHRATVARSDGRWTITDLAVELIHGRH